MVALIVIGAIILLAIWTFIAGAFSNVASMKGHHETRYFWMTFLFGIIGMLLVIALPVKTEKVAAYTAQDELPDL